MQKGSKQIVHLEALAARIMVIYKKYIEEIQAADNI